MPLEGRHAAATPPAAAHHRGGGRLAGMDGVRAVAALSVVVFHSWRYGAASGVATLDRAAAYLSSGVLLFFSLSGLLLYRPFAGAILGARPWPTVSTYAWNRGLRIFPAYWVILLVIGLLLGAATVPVGPPGREIGSLADHRGTLLADLLLVQNHLPATFLTGIGPAWTLSVELAFYALLPAVSWVAFSQARRRPRPALALLPPALFVGLSAVTQLVAAVAFEPGTGWDRSWHAVVVRSFAANSWLFAGGMVVAVVLATTEGGGRRLPSWWRKATLTALLLTVVVVVGLPGGQLGAPAFDLAGSIGAALFLALLVLGDGVERRPLVRLLETRPLVALGLISYSLYLWHEPLIRLAAERRLLPGPGVVQFGAVALTAGVVSVVCSAVTFVAVERPVLRRRRGGRGPAANSAGGATS